MTNDAHHSATGVGVVVVAAGLGTRLGAGMPKALVPLAGDPLVVHACRHAAAARGVRQLVLVVPPGASQQFARLVPDADIVEGGAERADSVAAGLVALRDGIDIVLVHDAARALAPVGLFDRVTEAVQRGWDAVVPGVAVHDTIKQVDTGGAVTGTPDRAALRAVQTPQGFARAVLERAHRAAGAAGAPVTDDAAMVERLGGSVLVVEGDERAQKVTTPADLVAAERRLLPAPGPTLIVLAGLPATGKTTLSRALAKRIPLTHLRVDIVEQAVVDTGLEPHPVGAVGYVVCFRLAAAQLALGQTVVADMVNGVPEARDGWRQVALDSGARMLRVELHCSDPVAHRARAESRTGDIPGLTQPTWEAIEGRDYRDWSPDLRFDTAIQDPDSIAQAVLRELKGQ